MIPVRVPADLMPVLANERRFAPMNPDHPLAGEPCPVCEEPLGGGTTVLVFAGIEAGDRKEGPGRWTTGAAVAVHARCAGVPATKPDGDASPDVHIDWHATPGEFRQLVEALAPNHSPYVERLRAEGKLEIPAVTP